MDIAEFLLARYAEDEVAARRAAFGYGAGWTWASDDAEDWSVVHADGKRDMVGCEDRDVTRHIARWDPARVLAECDAKRRIVEGCAVMRRTLDYYGVPTSFDDENILALLALPYADHPDYREEWRV